MMSQKRIFFPKRRRVDLRVLLVAASVLTLAGVSFAAGLKAGVENPSTMTDLPFIAAETQLASR